MPLMNSFSVSKGIVSGRFKNYIYRTPPGDLFGQNTTTKVNDEPVGDPGLYTPTPTPTYTPTPTPTPTYTPFEAEFVCEGVPPGSTVKQETLLICLYDTENMEHIDYVKQLVRTGVQLHLIDVSLPLYKVQNDLKMLTWSSYSEAAAQASTRCGDNCAFESREVSLTGVYRRVRNLAFLVYPLLTHDELECIIRTILPCIRPYFCFLRSLGGYMDVSVMTIIPSDASLQPRLRVIGDSMSVIFNAVCLTGSPCSSCSECKVRLTTIITLYFSDEFQFDQGVSLLALVQKMEKKLINMGNVKGMVVASKMQTIFHRMQYIEEKYKTLQHHLMNDMTYDGMLTDIEHIESKIKEVAIHIPMSYMDSNSLLHKLLSFKPNAHAPTKDPLCNAMPMSSVMVGDSLIDSFHIPGR